jgi:hypothetical protein
MNHEFFFYQHETSAALFGPGKRMYVGIELEIDKLRAYAKDTSFPSIDKVEYKQDYVIVEWNQTMETEHYTFYDWNEDKRTMELVFQHGRLVCLLLN